MAHNGGKDGARYLVQQDKRRAGVNDGGREDEVHIWRGGVNVICG